MKLKHHHFIPAVPFAAGREITVCAQGARLAAIRNRGLEPVLGVAFRVPRAGALPARKSRQAQDVNAADAETGRDPEIDALAGSVIEPAELTGTSVPQISAVYAPVTPLLYAMSKKQVRSCRSARIV